MGAKVLFLWIFQYQWPMMKTHYQPLSPGQLHHILSHYQMGGKPAPVVWTPTQEEIEKIQEEGINLSSFVHL